MSNCSLRKIEYRELATVWPQVRHWIIAALEYSGGRQSEKTVLDSLLKGLMQLWTVVDGDGKLKASLITEVMLYPTGLKVCDIFALGGEGWRDWVHLTPQLGEWGKQFGCTKMQITGREAWGRIFKDWGKVTVMIETPIGD